MANEFGLSLPLQLRIRSPRVNAEVILFIAQRALLLGQRFVDLSGATEFLSAITLA